jgi:hypothetical protein
MSRWVEHYNDVSYCLTWLCGRSRRETEDSLFNAWYCALSSPAPDTGHQGRDGWRFQIASLNTHGPSANGWSAAISPRSTAERSVRGLMPST